MCLVCTGELQNGWFFFPFHIHMHQYTWMFLGFTRVLGVSATTLVHYHLTWETQTPQSQNPSRVLGFPGVISMSVKTPEVWGFAMPKKNPKFLESWKCRNWRNPPTASWSEYPGWFFLNPKSSGPRRGAPRVISTWFHEYWWFMVYTLGISFWPILADVAFAEKQDLCMPHCRAILCCGNCLGQDGGGVKCMGRRSDDHGGGMWKLLTGNDLVWNSQHAFKLDTA